MKKILIVDDDVIVSFGMKALLESEGFEVIAVNSTKEAIEIAKKNSAIDLVLLDVYFNGDTEGVDCARAILASRQLPILFHSSVSDPLILKRIKEVTPFRPIEKGSSKETILSSIQNAYNKHRENYIFGAQSEEERLRLMESVVLNSNDAILITEAEPFDEPGPRILYVNKAFTDITGYTSEEVLGKTPRIMQGPESDKEAIKTLGKSLRNWQVSRATLLNYKKNGEKFWTELLISPVKNDKGWFTHWISVQREVTDRTEAEISMAQSQKRYKDLVTNIHVGVVVHHPDTSIMIVNKRAEDILGLSEDKLIGKKISDPYWSFLNEDGTRLLVEDYPVNQIIKTKKPIKGQVLGILHKEKGHIWVEVNGNCLLNDSEEIIEVIINLTDITETLNYQERLEELLVEKQTLLKEVHHRVKNNVNSIQSLLTIQKLSSKNPDVVLALNDTLNRVNSFRVLYDILLTSEDDKNVSVNAYLHKLTAKILESFDNAKKVDLQLSVEDFMLDSNVLSSVGIIINEIITNTLKYAFPDKNEGTIQLFLSKQNDIISLKILDNGTGLPEGFEIQNSTGFGLKLVSTLAQRIDGEISFSGGKEGTVFKLTFSAIQR
ncbi:MAG: PAS domain S-box protein [Cyclobacteriaceae bacterium]